jgi:uncharacterized protein (DUF58 family)
VLTRQGRIAALIAVLTLIAGRVLGSFELYLLGGIVAAVLLVAVIVVLRSRVRIDVHRDVHPARVHAGDLSRVRIDVRNDGKRRSPLLSLHDHVSGTQGARVLVSPLAPGSSASSSYALPTSRRGILTIGPLEVELTDPFGLAQTRVKASGLTQLTVYPHVDDVAPPPLSPGHDPMAGNANTRSMGGGGEDFYTLRNYVVGDDLRRVHWPSTARRDELMVRQDEMPWQGRVTVLVDTRKASTSPQSLELVASAAASVITASARRRDLVRMLTTEGSDSGFVAGHGQMGALMEHLAGLQLTPDRALRQVIQPLTQGTSRGALVVITGLVTPDYQEALNRVRRPFTSVTVVQVYRSSWDPAAPDLVVRNEPGVVAVTRSASFVTAWNQAFRARPRPTAWRGPATTQTAAAEAEPW